MMDKILPSVHIDISNHGRALYKQRDGQAWRKYKGYIL